MNGGYFSSLITHTTQLTFTYSWISELYSLQTNFLVPSISREETVSMYDGYFKFRTKRMETIYWTSNFLIPQLPIKLPHVFDNILSWTVDEWDGRGRIFFQETNWLPFTLKSYLFQKDPIHPRNKRQWISLAFYFS